MSTLNINRDSILAGAAQATDHRPKQGWGLDRDNRPTFTLHQPLTRLPKHAEHPVIGGREYEARWVARHSDFVTWTYRPKEATGKVTVSVSMSVEVDLDEWVEAYGLDPNQYSAAVEDAREHVRETAREAAKEAFRRQAAGASLKERRR